MANYIENPIVDPVIVGPDLPAEFQSHEPPPVLPPWTPPEQNNTPGSGDINDVAVSISKRTLTVSPFNTFVPILLGEDTIGPIQTLIKVESGFLYLRHVWCIGEVEQVINVELEDGSVPTGTIFTHYKGAASDGIDNTLQNLIPGYSDTMAVAFGSAVVRLCYSVIKTPITSLEGFPKWRARIKGLKVRDPRASTAYTDTAGLLLAHLIENDVYGLGATIDDASLTVLANRNEVILDDGAGYTEPRSAIGLLIKSRKSVTQYIEVLRGYARCRLVRRAGIYYFYPDMPTATTFSVVQGDIVSGSFTPVMRDIRKQPNRVRVYFTDRSTFPWEDSFVEVETPEVTSGSETIVEATYRMNGFFTKPSALRFAYDKINERLRTFSTKFLTTIKFYDKEEGETFTISHPYLDGTPKMRLISKRKVGVGMIEIIADKDDDNIYSNEIADNTIVHGDISTQDPFTVQPITGLSLALETPKYQTSIYYSRIRATWTHTIYPYNFLYRVSIKVGGDLIDSRTVKDTEIVFPIVPEDVTVEVGITVLGFGGSESSEVTATKLITGKDFPPSDVPNFLGYHFDGQVFLEWGYAADNAEIWYYEIQYGTAAFAWGDVNSKEVVTRIDTRQFVATAIPPGTWDFLIKAVDNAGNQSTNATRVSGIVVTTSSGAFLLTSGSLPYSSQSNMTLSGIDWVTKMGSSWNATFTLPWNANYTSSFYSYGSGLATEWISDSLDAGAILTATWQITSHLEVVSGSPTIIIQTSDDDAIWTDHSGVLSVIATARYIRVKVTGTSSDRYVIRAPFFDVAVNVVTIDESFKGTTNGSGEIVFDLQQSAISFESLVASINDLTTNADRVLIAPVESVAPFTQVKVVTLDAATPEPSVEVSARVRYV